MPDLFRMELGNSIYVWSKHQGSASSSECIVSAHGGGGSQFPTSKQYPVGLAYYVQHGSSVIATMEEILMGEKAIVEVLGPHNSLDYDLGKFQGCHGGKGFETYDSLKGQSDSFDRELAQWQQKLATAGEQGARAHWRSKIDGAGWKDIVTIRNREFYGSDVMLSDVLWAMKKHKYFYELVHCSFCRG